MIFEQSNLHTAKFYQKKKEEQKEFRFLRKKSHGSFGSKGSLQSQPALWQRTKEKKKMKERAALISIPRIPRNSEKIIRTIEASL